MICTDIRIGVLGWGTRVQLTRLENFTGIVHRIVDRYYSTKTFLLFDLTCHLFVDWNRNPVIYTYSFLFWRGSHAKSIKSKVSGKFWWNFTEELSKKMAETSFTSLSSLQPELPLYVRIKNINIDHEDFMENNDYREDFNIANLLRMHLKFLRHFKPAFSVHFCLNLTNIVDYDTSVSCYWPSSTAVINNFVRRHLLPIFGDRCSNF